MATGRLGRCAMVETLAEWMARGADVTEDDRRHAQEALDALGVPDLLHALAMAERILRFGNSFHSIAGFFADGSAEQSYVLRLGSAEALSGDFPDDSPKPTR